MEMLQTQTIEQEIINIITGLCEKSKIGETVDGDFCPGSYIKSHVLISIIPEIENKIGITIPLACYIFSDKDKNQLSIKKAVAKLLKQSMKAKRTQKKNA